jgi:hypothetical protein
MPCFLIPLHEYNKCHDPGGTPEGGQFCSTPGSGSGLKNYPRPEGSKDIPDFLKQDVLNAARAGIVVRHHQQPEPVLDIAGVLHDPLALSHARGGTETFASKGVYGLIAPRGAIRIMTRGGEFEPTVEVWGSSGYPQGRKKKELTPEMLPAELRATVHDVQSTFRHEVGHLMDDESSWPKKGAKYDTEMQREVRAWVYAVEISPDHTVSERMVRNGLMSHAYGSFRKAQILTDDEHRYVQRQGWMDQQETLERIVQNESKMGVVNIEAHRKAEAFTNRVLRALVNYGKVLTRKGIVRVPQAKDPYFPLADKRRLMQPGPGQHAWPGLL